MLVQKRYELITGIACTVSGLLKRFGLLWKWTIKKISGHKQVLWKVGGGGA